MVNPIDMRRLLLAIGLLGGATDAYAADVPIIGLKLIVVDKTVAAGTAKAVFVAKEAGVAKGVGTDPTQIEATLEVAYGAASGTFTMPQGGNWVANSASVAKYVNKDAPTGGAVKVSVIKPASLVKVVGKSLGDVSLDISAAPFGPVYVVDTIVNGGDTTRLCTQFTECVHKLIASDTGYKLICKGNSTGDAACAAATSDTLQDLGNGTVYDSETDLQWEQKDTAVGSGMNAGNLHDVDNTYTWAGRCTLDTAVLCQPNAAAAATCTAQTGGAFGCAQCGVGDGTCDADPLGGAITTIWDWLSQLNAAGFAGHSDWRLPSESGCNSCYTGDICTSCDDHELETILRSPYIPCGITPCIDEVFGPTASHAYWSASTFASNAFNAWLVSFNGGSVTPVSYIGKISSIYYARAVRDTP